MEQFWNALKARAGGLDGLSGRMRYGLVSSFDPTTYAAKVLLQPENVLSGWLPVMSPWVGPGWGLSSPIQPGMQVLIMAQEGDAEQGVVIGAIWSNIDKAPGAPVGEFWVQHASGSYFKMHNNGGISMQATTVTLQGNLVVTGDISDQNGSHGTLNMLRSDYDAHIHAVPGAGTTGLPNMTL